MNTTDIIASYAAVVASGLLFWDIFKWKKTGLRVSFTASPNMKVYGDPLREGRTYISIRARNTGDRPTTITALGLRWYTNCLHRLFKKSDIQGFINNPGVPHHLPYVIQPGGIWDGLAIQKDVMKEMPKKGILIFELYLSHKNKPKRVRVVISR